MQSITSSGLYDAKGASIYYNIQGDSGEYLLFIHAGIADMRMWEKEAFAMSEYFRVIRFDLPGYGCSDFTGGSFNYNEIILGLLEHLGVDKAHIIAASFGGQLAIDFALAYPERVLSMVVASPALSGWEGSKYLERFDEQEEELLTQGKIDEVAELNFQMWYVGQRKQTIVSASVKQLILDMQLNAMYKGMPQTPIEELEEEDNLPRLKELQMPVLVIVGEYDLPDFRAMSTRIFKDVKNAKKVVISNAAHLSNLEHPEEFLDHLKKFLIK